MRTGFVRTYLPPQPEIIETSSITGLRVFMQDLFETRNKTGRAVIGVVTGKVGSGKTLGGRAYLESLSPDLDSLLPGWLWIDSLPRLKKERLMRVILTRIEGTPLRKVGKRPTLTKVIEALFDNKVELIVLDYADLLTAESFELIEDLVDYSQTIILFLDLPEFTQKLKRSEKLASAAKFFEFKMLSVEEIRAVLLPNLKIPHWHFDPNCMEDRELGRYLCQQEDLSLRRLRIMLQAASFITEIEGTERITIDTLKKTLTLFNLGSD